MTILYLMAVWVHILTIAVWIGAMFFADPRSTRMTSQLVERAHGVGWYAQAVVWTTGLFMLNYDGVSPSRLVSAEFVSTRWGQAIWAKLSLVILMLIFQIVFSHKRGLFAYLITIFTIVAISVMIARPVFF